MLYRSVAVSPERIGYYTCQHGGRETRFCRKCWIETALKTYFVITNMSKSYPSERCYHFARNVCVSKLQGLSDDDLRAILPSLVRMSQCPSLDESAHWQEARREIQKFLCGMEVVNSIVGLLSVDFGCLRQDCVKEKQMQRKLEESSSSSHSALVEAAREGLALDFERSESARRLRLVLRELLRVMNKVYDDMTYFYCFLSVCNKKDRLLPHSWPKCPTSLG